MANGIVSQTGSDTSLTAMTLSRKWASTPVDERFPSVHDISVESRRRHDRTKYPVVRIGDLHLVADQDRNDVRLIAPKGETEFTHRSFSKFATTLGIGDMARGMRQMPAENVKHDLEFWMDRSAGREVMAHIIPPNGEYGQLLTMTGPNYGVIPHYVMTEGFERFNERQGGVWGMPTENAGSNQVRNSTAYMGAAGTYLWVFQADETKTFETNGTFLKRGLMFGNDEGGDNAWFVIRFTYDWMCGNRILHGLGNVGELRGIHRRGAVDKFIELVEPVLDRMQNEDFGPVLKQIEGAKTTFLGKTEDDVATVLTDRKWKPVQIEKTMDFAKLGGEYGGSGDPTILWNVVAGATAYARDIPRQDDRLAMERTAGALLDLVKV